MIYSHTHSYTTTSSQDLSELFLLQQDTIPTTQGKDTLESKHQGIDPLFLMIERKSQEVEAYKEQVAIQRLRAREQARPKVDTTCHLCPSSEKIPLQSIIISQKTDNTLFGAPKLYDKDFFFVQVGSNKPVFIETEKTVTLKPSESLNPIPISKETFAFDVGFFILFGLVAFSIAIKVFFSNYFHSLFQSNIYFSVASKLTRESSLVWNRLFLMLDLVFFISIPLALFIAIDYMGIVDNLDFDSKIIALFALGGLIIFRVFRILASSLVGFLSRQPTTFEFLNHNQFIFPRTLGIILTPLMVLIIYSPREFSYWVFYFMLFIVGVAILLRLTRTIQVFLFKGFSIFYIILYLCALEIIPILLVYKLVVGE